MLVLGVDPGKNGAAVVLRTDPLSVMEHLDCPLFEIAAKGGKKSRQLDVRTIGEWLRHLTRDVLIQHAWIEKVNAFAGESARNSFEFGETYGAWRAAMAALELPFSEVPPAGWKKAMRLNADKELSRKVAIALFTGQSELFRLKKHDGRAEAGLIAYYGAMTLRAVMPPSFKRAPEPITTDGERF
jgi:crossover junction endodeoxyribonuclease RuvC